MKYVLKNVPLVLYNLFQKTEGGSSAQLILRGQHNAATKTGKLNKLRIEGSFLVLIKNIYKKTLHYLHLPKKKKIILNNKIFPRLGNNWEQCKNIQFQHSPLKSCM